MFKKRVSDLTVANQIFLYNSGVVVETRECGGALKPDVHYDQCTMRTLGGEARVTVCHCDQDGCNADNMFNFLKRKTFFDSLASLF